MSSNQREGGISNAKVGSDFEEDTYEYFKEHQQLILKPNIKIEIGVSNRKLKLHAFDLGCEEKKILVECKSHKWTAGDNVPSAKLTVWNEAMYYFMASPKDYRKIMFVLKDYNKKRKVSLASYYIKKYGHLIPDDVEFWEFDENAKTAEKLTIIA